jgi:hypothetical protein
MKRNYFILLFVIISFSSIGQSADTIANDTMLDSLFKHHFNSLDSAVLSKRTKRYYCCSGSINFMEKNTRIISSSEKTFLGKISFSIIDLIKWHEWYLRNSFLKKTPVSNSMLNK